MSRSSTNDDPRFKKAVKKIIDNINVSVPDGMKCADYLPAEVQDMSLQQRIRRAVQRARGIKQPPPTMNIDTSTMSTVSTLTATPLSTKQKAKKVRHTSKAVHQLRKNKLLDREAKSNATKYATKLYAEYQKKEKKLSAEKVSAIVEKELGIRVPKRTIQNNFALGRIGTSPKKKGPKGHFDNDTVLNLTNSFETYVKIKQLNGQSGDVTYKKLQKLLKQCTSQKKDVDCVWLMTRLLQESGVDLNVGRSNNAEQRRIMWTTYYNLKSWFNNWERDLLELGFAKKVDGKTIIPEDQLARILNIDETCLVMDGSSSQRGGRPAVVFTSGALPDLKWK